MPVTDLPAGYVMQRERGAIVVALPHVIELVVRAIATRGSLYASAAAERDAQVFTGRGMAYRLVRDDEDWVVRHYRRGGAIAHVLDDEFLRAGEVRPLRELRASTSARARSVPTPEVTAAVIYPSAVFYRADLATRYIPRGTDLATIALGGGVSNDTRLAAWRAAGQLLRSAFAAGVDHADLNLRNILIQTDAQGTRAWLLDLDRAVVRDRELSDVARNRILERLHRSRRKLEAATHNSVSAEQLAVFDAALRGAA
jgi:3-deoxy-D-manno-octulosonic acid kinase